MHYQNQLGNTFVASLPKGGINRSAYFRWLRSETGSVASEACAVDSLYLLFLLQVFENRERPEARPIVGNTRAYLMAINKKGTDALKLAKVDLTPLIPAHNGRIGEPFALCLGNLSVAHSVGKPAGPPICTTPFAREQKSSWA